MMLVMVGCSSIPMAGIDQDLAVKKFMVKPDKANIYVYRKGRAGSLVSMGVELDGSEVGVNLVNSYLALEVSPGEHILTSHAGNTSYLKINVEAGKNYFVRQEATVVFFIPRTRLQLVSEAEGKDTVGWCRLVDSVAYQANQ
jgi:hypothetical protein